MCLGFLAPIGIAMGASETAAAAAGTMAVLQVAAAAASAGVSFAGQKASADAQAAQFKQSERLSQANLVNQYQEMAVRQRQEQIAKAQQVEQLTNEASKAYGNIQTTAGESGITGNTVSILMEEFKRQQTESLSNLNLNYDFRQRQLQIEQLGLQGQTQANIIRSYPTQAQPSILSPIFQTGGAALGAVDRYGSPTGMGRYWLGNGGGGDYNSFSYYQDRAGLTK